MPYTPKNFKNLSAPPIDADWLNGVDVTCNSALNGAQTVAQVLAALGLTGLASPVPATAGGTGATSAAAGLAALGGTTLAAAEAAINPYPVQTAAEIAAGVTPTNYAYAPGNVLRYGATGTLSGTDQSGIQAAIAVAAQISPGAQVYIPAGNYLWTATTLTSVPNGCKIKGDGRYASVITTNNVAGQVFYVNGTGASIESMGFASNVVNTSGVFVQLAGTENSLEDFHISGDVTGVYITGVAAKVRKGWFGQGAPSGTRISVNCGDASPFLSDILEEVQSGSYPANGLLLTNCTSGYFTNIEMNTNTGGLSIEPGVGQRVQSCWFIGCSFDGSGLTARPIYINPASGGVVGDLNFIGCWSGDGTSDGVLINNPGGATIVGINFYQHTSQSNAGQGFNTAGTMTNINIQGGSFTANTQAGIYGNHVGDITINGVQSGAYQGASANGTYGLVLSANITSVAVTNSQFVNTAGIGNVDDLSTPATKIISGNVGYVTRNSGYVASVTSATTNIAHGLSATPTIVLVQPMNGTATAAYPTTIGATNFQITFTGGGAQPFSWQASIGNVA